MAVAKHREYKKTREERDPTTSTLLQPKVLTRLSSPFHLVTQVTMRVRQL